MKAEYFSFSFRFLGFFLVSLFLSPSVSAQDSLELNLGKAIEMAWDNNLNLMRTRKNLENSKLDVDAARYQQLPIINGSASTGFNWGRNIDPTSNDFIQQRIYTAGLSANASLTVFDGLRVRNQILQSKQAFEAGKLGLEDAKNQIALSVTQSYLNIVLQIKLQENAVQQKQQLEEQLSLTRKLYNAGSVAEPEVLDLEGQLATAEANVIDIQNQLSLAYLNFKQLLQIEASENISIAIPQIDPDDLVPPAESVEDIYEVASSTQPSILNAEAVIRARAYGYEVARSNFYPSVSVNARTFTNYSDAFQRPEGFNITGFDTITSGFLTNNPNETVALVQPEGTTVFNDVPFSDQFSENFAQSLSLSINIPILNQFNARIQTQRARIAREQAEIDKKIALNQLRQDIESAYLNVRTAYTTYQANLKQVTALDKSYEANKSRYEAGALNATDYNISLSNLTVAKNNLLRARYDFVFKTKLLDFYLNKPITFE